MKTEHVENNGNRGKLILDGINVLDFGWALFGSLIGRYLADHGARVVKVESAKRPDAGRRMMQTAGKDSPVVLNSSPWFTHLNSSKYGLSIDLKHPRAKEVINRLIEWADVINENFAPGVIDKLGYGYEQARAINPDIIMVSNSAYGQSGPKAHRRGNDGHGASLSGFLYLTGYAGEGPTIPNLPYGDVIVPFVSVAAVAAALDYRRRTGKGQYIDTSMIEVCSHQTTPAFLEKKANKQMPERQGNRVVYASPHGVFPCKGDDDWCTISIFTDEEWNAFCNAIGNPVWCRESRFSDLSGRKANEDDLERFVAEWTQTLTAQDVMHRLQTAGVPAGVVQTLQDVVDHDPQLKTRNFLKPLTHPVLGEFGHMTAPFIYSKTDLDVRTSPCLGEHTELVCKDFLGMTDAEFNELSEQKVFD